MFIVLSRAGFMFKVYSTSFVSIWYVLCWFLGILSCDAQAKAASSVGGLPVAPAEPSPASDREAEILRVCQIDVRPSWFLIPPLALQELYMWVWIPSTQQVFYPFLGRTFNFFSQFDCSQEPQREGILGCRGTGLGRLQEGVGRAVFPFNDTSLQPQLYFSQVVSWFMTSCFPWFMGFQQVLFGHR